MGENSTISWTTHSFNGWIGCTKVAAGCKNCYAEAYANRYGRAIWGPGGTRSVTSPSNWRKPLAWNKLANPLVRTRKMTDPVDIIANAAIELQFANRPRVFTNSLADVFEDWNGPVVGVKGKQLWTHLSSDQTLREGDDDGWMDCNGWSKMTMDMMRFGLFKLIDATPNLDWLILTKRPENIRRMWPRVGHNDRWMDHDGEELGRFVRFPNVWLGCSVATQADADKNIPELLKCRDLAQVLFVSAEPLIEKVDLDSFMPAPLPALDHAVSGPRGPCLDWIIVGGESGPGARQCEMDWIANIIRQCKEAGVACFVKQLGKFPIMTLHRDDGEHQTRLRNVADSKGEDPAEWPEDLRVREFPKVSIS